MRVCTQKRVSVVRSNFAIHFASDICCTPLCCNELHSRQVQGHLHASSRYKLSCHSYDTSLTVAVALALALSLLLPPLALCTVCMPPQLVSAGACSGGRLCFCPSAASAGSLLLPATVCRSRRLELQLQSQRVGNHGQGGESHHAAGSGGGEGQAKRRKQGSRRQGKGHHIVQQRPRQIGPDLGQGCSCQLHSLHHLQDIHHTQPGLSRSLCSCRLSCLEMHCSARACIFQCLMTALWLRLPLASQPKQLTAAQPMHADHA